MKLFCFIGPSGVGKSALQNYLPPQVTFLTNYSTRELRDGEWDGYHITHISREDFEDKMRHGLIANVTEYAGNLYGAPWDSIINIVNYGIPYYATATKDSVRRYKKLIGADRVITIYVKPPSIEVLADRMRKRGDSEEDIARRIAHIFSDAELENEKIADYVIVNDDFETAKTIARGIIYKELYIKKEDEI